MSVYTMGNLRIIDLTKYIDRHGKQKMRLMRFNTGGPYRISTPT